MDTVFNPILEVRNLNKSYKDFSLQNVSFSLPEGCITGFIGANGAGKTTTINTILGLAGMDSSGKGVFFSTHITSDLDKIADVLVLIDHGSILFEEEKDILLDSHRMVKGSARWLTEKARSLFSSITETDFGFTGLTGQPDQVRALMPDAVMERPLIEDIMLDAIGKNAPAAKRCKTAAVTGPHDTF